MKDFNTRYSFITNESSKSFYYPFQFKEFKEKYKEDKKLLEGFSIDLLHFLDNLDYEHLKKTKKIVLNYNTEEEELKNELTNFIISLEDKELIQEYAKIINNENTITISNETNDLFCGTCIEEDGIPYINLIRRNTLEDFTTLAHEMGHALQYTLFKDHTNDYIKYSFFEVSSYYFELLMMDYIENKTNFNIPAALLINNKINYINSYIWKSHLANFINSLKTFDENLIKDYASNSFSINCIHDDISKLTIPNIEESTNLISSFMIACNLYLETINDKEEGIDKYKNLMTSHNCDLMKFLDYNNVNFIKDNTPYDLLKIQSEIAYKKLIK